MSSDGEPGPRLEIGHVLTMDVVEYSKLLITEQTAVLSELTQIVKETPRFRRADADGKLLRIATGDGMSLVFFDDPQAPIECAVEIATALKSHPNIRLRIGIHSGPVNHVLDVNDRSNIAGAGIDIAQRVMDCGDAGHILLSKRVADDLAPVPRWNVCLHELGECEVKHGRKISLVNFFTDEVGNPALPGKCESQLATRSTIAGQSGRRRVAAVAGALLLIALVLAALFSSKQHQASSHAIAVLPFENTSDDPNTEYLAEGISEALINSLAELKQLRVTARASAFRYKGKDIDARRVGRELDVTEVLTGKVRQVNDALNVQVDLVDTATGAQLWGAGYDRKMADLIAVKEAIAKEVAEKLKVKLTSEEQQRLAKRESLNPEAYQYYLRGRYFLNKRSADGIRNAIQQFQQATEHDPDFALSYAGLADCYIALTFYNFAAPHETMPKAKQSALKTLALDNNVAEAHTSLGNILVNYDWNWAEAEKEFKRGIELRPDYATAHQWYAMHYLTPTGRLEEAIKEMKKAVELEPASLVTNSFMGATLFYARRYDEAIDQCRRTVAMEPNFAVAHWQLALSYGQKQMFDGAIEECQKADSLSGGSPLMKAALGYAYASSQRKREAQMILEQLNRFSTQQYVSPYEVAAIHVALGDHEQALRLLEDAYNEHAFHLVRLNVSPQFESLRLHPKFQDLVKRLGLPR